MGQTNVRASTAEQPLEPTAATVVLIRADSIGKGDNELGRVLIQRVLNILVRRADKPQAVVFINGGVQLLLRSAPTAAAVQHLMTQGVSVLADATSVEYYRMNLSDLLGQVVSTETVTDQLMLASKVVTL